MSWGTSSTHPPTIGRRRSPTRTASSTRVYHVGYADRRQVGVPILKDLALRLSLSDTLRARKPVLTRAGTSHAVERRAMRENGRPFSSPQPNGRSFSSITVVSVARAVVRGNNANTLRSSQRRRVRLVKKLTGAGSTAILHMQREVSTVVQPSTTNACIPSKPSLYVPSSAHAHLLGESNPARRRRCGLFDEVAIRSNCGKDGGGRAEVRGNYFVARRTDPPRPRPRTIRPSSASE